MDYKKLREPLKINQIDFRVQSINRRGDATILAYKDARVDMDILDEVCGAQNWKREHLNGNANCIVSIWDGDKSQWISKEDTGTESNTEKEKGLASDSFKRACFNWGIGRELYEYPVIKIKLNADAEKPQNGEWYIEGDRAKQGFGLKIKEWRWVSEFTDGKLTFLAVADENNKARFIYGKKKDANPQSNV